MSCAAGNTVMEELYEKIEALKDIEFKNNFFDRVYVLNMIYGMLRYCRIRNLSKPDEILDNLFSKLEKEIEERKSENIKNKNEIFNC